MDIRLPNITGATTVEQVAQLKSYLYQMVEQLNWALSTAEAAKSGDTKNVVVGSSAGNDVEMSEQDILKTFGALKSLIIKSADIANAYYEETKEKYDAEYLAKSEFGNYSREASQIITKNADFVNKEFQKVEAITDELTSQVKALAETEAWIKSGLLDEAENIYGLEIGKRELDKDGNVTFSRYARFTSSGVYLYYPGYDSPVAYISQEKLYITNAEILGTLTLGGYRLDLTDGIAFKWMGGAV